MTAKIKLPKQPIQPSFYMNKPTPPLGKEKEVLVFGFDNDTLDGMSIEELYAKAKSCADLEGVREYHTIIRQTYCSSESGYVEFDLRIVYNDKNPSESDLKAYEKELEKYNKKKAEHEEKMVAYKAAKAEYDAAVKAFNEAKEIELLNKLIKKHGVPSEVTK